MPLPARNQLIRFLAAALLCCGAAAARAAVPMALRACGDQNEFHPYTYFVRDGATRTETVGRYSSGA